MIWLLFPLSLLIPAAALVPSTLPAEGFSVSRTLVPPQQGFTCDIYKSQSRPELLHLQPSNVTLPVALMCLDPTTYPSLSRARKACRKGNVLLSTPSTPSVYTRGRAYSRVLSSTLISLQSRTSHAFYPSENSSTPPFKLPVIYEDDHLAVVNKPAGVVVYSHKKGGHGLNTIRACLPHVLHPPPEGTEGTLRRPQPVHRLDKPTSGLLVIAKTKTAMSGLSGAFANREVEKEYVAILNGVPEYPSGT